MKKNYTLFTLAILLIFSATSFSQVFTYTKVDTAKYGTPTSGDFVFHSILRNNTSSAIVMDVVRDQDVIPEAADWYTAFCMDVCYLPSVDSVQFTFNPTDSIEFAFHMTYSNTPDHATAKMRWKNIATASNTFKQAYFGSTDGAQAGVNDLATNAANVNIYPMPVVAGDVFSMNVSAVKTQNTISLVVYNTLGSVVNRTSVISGINLMNLDLPSGMYSYSLVSNNQVLNSGKLSVVK